MEFRISKVIFHFSFESSFKKGGKNLLQSILDFLSGLKFI